jgi:hypothetical protein
MRIRVNSPRSGSEVTMGRKAVAVGAIGLLAALGVAAPSGAASVKPVAPVAHTALADHVAKKVTKITHVAFKGSYKGTIGLLWSSSGVQATSVSGSGTGTDGATRLTGAGSGTAASSCDPFSGAGSLVGTSGLKLNVVKSTKTQACAVNSAAPTPVTVNGVATILSGTGKFKGATGTLSFKGQFSIQATTAGSRESDSFTATLTGTVTIRTVVTVK